MICLWMAMLLAQQVSGPPLPLRQAKLPIQADVGMVSWPAIGRNGERYVIQRGDKADPVLVLDGEGRVLRSWGKGLYVMPHAIRLDRQGNVWTLDAASSKVIKFSNHGKKLLEIAVGGQPTPCRNNFCGTTDIAFAPNGHLFISDGYANARILEYSPDGRKLREWGRPGDGPGEFRLPHAIVCDEKGILYVADRENARIQRFDLTGKYLGEWTGFGRTFGLELAGDALWLVTQPRLEKNGAPGSIVKLDRATGRILGVIASGGGGHGIAVGRGGEVITAPGPSGPAWFPPRNLP